VVTAEREKIVKTVLDGTFEVHAHLGPGLPESACQTGLLYELREKGIHAEAKVALPVVYKGVTIDCGYRVDILVEKDKLMVENKAVKNRDDLHLSQILSYVQCGLKFFVE
jgi:GxxExxY protein